MKRSVVVACAGPPGYLDVLCNDCDSRVKVQALTIEEAVAAAAFMGWSEAPNGGVNCPARHGRVAEGHI